MRMMAFVHKSNRQIFSVNPTDEAKRVYDSCCAENPKYSDGVDLVEVDVAVIEPQGAPFEETFCQLCGQSNPDKNHFCQG